MEKRGNWKSVKSDLNITWPLISWATIWTSRWCSKVSAELREWKSQKQCLASSLCSISESSLAVFLPPSLLPSLPPSFSLHWLSPWAFYGATKGIWFHPNCLNFQTLREFWVLAESQYWNRADHTVIAPSMPRYHLGSFVLGWQCLATSAAPPLESFFWTVSRERILSPNPVFYMFYWTLCTLRASVWEHILKITPWPRGLTREKQKRVRSDELWSWPRIAHLGRLFSWYFDLVNVTDFFPPLEESLSG